MRLSVRTSTARAGASDAEPTLALAVRLCLLRLWSVSGLVGAADGAGAVSREDAGPVAEPASALVELLLVAQVPGFVTLQYQVCWGEPFGLVPSEPVFDSDAADLGVVADRHFCGGSASGVAFADGAFRRRVGDPLVVVEPGEVAAHRLGAASHRRRDLRNVDFAATRLVSGLFAALFGWLPFGLVPRCVEAGLGVDEGEQLEAAHVGVVVNEAPIV